MANSRWSCLPGHPAYTVLPRSPREGNLMSSIAGRWTAEAKSPIGLQRFVITIEDGDPPSGTIGGDDGQMTLDDLTVSDHTATFNVSVERPIKITVNWSVTAEGDTLIGTAKPGYLPAMKVTGTRA